MQHEAAHRNAGPYELLAALDCPDLAPSVDLLWVVAHALNVRIKLFGTVSTSGKLGKCIADAGLEALPTVLVLKGKPVANMASFCSLLPDESGRAVIELLEHQRSLGGSASVPAVKRMSWAWTNEQRTRGPPQWRISCYNEYRDASQATDLTADNRLHRMDTFVVTVNDPLHVSEAIRMLTEAIKCAPNQQRSVRTSPTCDMRRMRPHCSADCEFVKLPRDIAHKFAEESRDLVRNGTLEELCSVLTFAVGRHFCVMFNIVHMLENANEHTVGAIELLLRETIFDASITKLWWNPQADIRVLDTTIAHMYQGTVRPPFLSSTWDGERLFTVTPKFRFTSAHLNGFRPGDLHFPTELKVCDLHIGPDATRLEDNCSCRLGNIDLAALLGHFCRLQGLSMPKLSWCHVRGGFKYWDLLYSMLSTGRLWPIMDFMKHQAEQSPLGVYDFYQGLGTPDMSLDDQAMAYNIGDVVGQNLIFEELFASDDKRFVGGALNAFHSGGSYNNRRRALRALPTRRIRQHLAGYVGDIPLFLDNPKSFQDAGFKQDDSPDKFGAPYRHGAKGHPLTTESLSLRERDQRVSRMRKLGKPSMDTPLTAAWLYEAPPIAAPSISAHLGEWGLDEVQPAATQPLDPTRVWVPSDCVYALEREYERPIVRAGTTHAEALVMFLRSPQAQNAARPPGFGAIPGSREGLPAWLKRVPGHGLDMARDISDAFGHKLDESTAPFSKHVLRSVDEQKIFDTAIEKHLASANGDVWSAATQARVEAGRLINSELWHNMQRGRPYSYDARDFLDPDGREYRRRVDAAAVWNRPPLRERYEMGLDGEWRSLATVTLEVLNKRLPAEDSVDAKKWETVSSRKQRTEMR